MFRVVRDPWNPLVGPNVNEPWQALATFNPSPVVRDGITYMLYRASRTSSLYRGVETELSTIGICQSRDGIDFTDRRLFIEPEADWDRYGLEDPRVTELDGTYYVFYTGLAAMPPAPRSIRVGVALSSDLQSVERRHLVTPFNAKAMALFPKRVGGKLTAILTVHSDTPPSKIAIAQFDTPEEMWSAHFWSKWYANVDRYVVKLAREESDHIEVGAAPVETERGWLLVYAHIQNYFAEEDRVFGVEAALLDIDDPVHVIARTQYPFMVPEEGPEIFGRLPHIIFPSGAILDGERLDIYYGATDMTCCRASVKVNHLLDSLSADDNVKQHVTRYQSNPILEPIAEHGWEAKYVFNPGAIEIDGSIYLLYRAMGRENISAIGLALSRDGYRIVERLPDPVYVPRAAFEEKAGGPRDPSGCEDPRVVRIGDRIHITYTGYNGVDLPRVAASSISVDDFLARRWDRWEVPEVISPAGIDDKDAAIFAEPINGQYMVLHRIERHICVDSVYSLDFRREMLSSCLQLIGPRRGMWDNERVGIAGPPTRVGDKWLLFYHGVNDAHQCCLGALLLDGADPTIVIGRTNQPIMTPVEEWERSGWINDVVFPCGQVIRNGLVHLYYGAADTVVGVATIKVDTLLDYLA